MKPSNKADTTAEAWQRRKFISLTTATIGETIMKPLKSHGLSLLYAV